MTTDATVTNVIRPVEIDVHFLPTRSARVVERAVGNDLVLLDLDSGVTHALNSIGAIFWQSLDGETSLAELTEDLAAAGAGAGAGAGEDLTGQVLAWARALGVSGLFAGVEPSDADVLGLDSSVAQGDPLPPIDGERLDDGTSVSLPPPGGRRSLTINWSFGCGFCLGMIDDLVEASPHAAANGVDVILVVAGMRAEVEDVATTHGVTHLVVLAEHDENGPFHDLGTPVAYVVDGDGIVVEPVAVGANEVSAVLSRLAGLRPAPAAAPGDVPVPGPDDSRYLPLPPSAGVCAPSASRPVQSWVDTRAYRVGDLIVGVRTASPAAAELVRDLLAPVAHPAPHPQPNYSVVLADDDDTSRRALNLLMWGNTVVVRTRSPRRVLEALLGHLSALTEPHHPDVWPIGAFPLIGEGRAILLPDVLWSNLAAVQPRLAQAGLSMVDPRPAFVDTETVELIVPETLLPHDASVLERLAPTSVARTELAPAVPGRYPLAGWCFVDPGPAAVSFGATALAQAAAAIDRPVHAARLDETSALLMRVPAIPSDGSLRSVIHESRERLAASAAPS